MPQNRTNDEKAISKWSLKNGKFNIFTSSGVFLSASFAAVQNEIMAS